MDNFRLVTASLPVQCIREVDASGADGATPSGRLEIAYCLWRSDLGDLISHPQDEYLRHLIAEFLYGGSDYYSHDRGDQYSDAFRGINPGLGSRVYPEP